MEQQPASAAKPGDARSGERSNPELITISQPELNRKMAKQKGHGERAILNQLGLAAKDQLPQFVAELQNLRAAQQAQRHTASQLARLTGDLAAFQERCQELCEELAALQEAHLLRAAGVPEQELAFYAFMSHKLAREQGLCFEEALALYVGERPPHALPLPLHLTAGRAETRPSGGLRNLARAAERAWQASDQ